nr:hypothetical protein OH826_14565 [Streptomyces sp. NBC_00899]
MSRKRMLVWWVAASAVAGGLAVPAVAWASGPAAERAPAVVQRAAQGAPDALTATAVVRADGQWNLDTLRLTWRPAQDTEPTEYQVWLNGAFAQRVLFGAPTSGQTVHYVNVGESPDTEFAVKIRAKLPSGAWSAFSNEYTITTPR